jgi:hypothetical protein
VVIGGGEGSTIPIGGCGSGLATMMGGCAALARLELRSQPVTFFKNPDITRSVSNEFRLERIAGGQAPAQARPA